MPTSRHALFLLGVLTACSDYNFTEEKDPEPGTGDTGRPDDPVDPDTGEVRAPPRLTR